jgi:hypothetical protein
MSIAWIASPTAPSFREQKASELNLRHSKNEIHTEANQS